MSVFYQVLSSDFIFQYLFVFNLLDVIVTFINVRDNQ